MSKHKCNTLENGVMVWERIDGWCKDTILVMPSKAGVDGVFISVRMSSPQFNPAQIGIFFDTPEQLGDLIQILTQARTSMKV